MHWPRAPRQARTSTTSEMLCKKLRHSACISVVPLFQVQVTPDTILSRFRLADPAPAASSNEHLPVRDAMRWHTDPGSLFPTRERQKHQELKKRTLTQRAGSVACSRFAGPPGETGEGGSLAFWPGSSLLLLTFFAASAFEPLARFSTVLQTASSMPRSGSQ